MLIFIDIETTGLDAEDTMVSIALLNGQTQEYIYELVNEGKKIPPKASSIHHITNEMIQDKFAFKESKSYQFLQGYNTSEHTLVAHNIKFDLEKLASDGMIWKGDIIDTLKCTKHLIPECELFSLQVLRYELKLYRDEKELQKEYGIKETLFAHHALSDALVDKLLFDTLLEYSTVDEMKELSFKNVLLEKFTFGKYKEKYIEEVAHNDRAYLEWLLYNAKNIDEDVLYSINYYLQGQ